MKQLRSTMSWPVVILVALALLLGGIGTAVAGPPVAKITKAQVKKIAGKVVDKKAASLTVAKATTATTAGTAGTLNGAPAATYLDRVAQQVNPDFTALPTTTLTPLLPDATLTVPSGVGFVHVTGQASFNGGTASTVLYIAQDATACSSPSGFGYVNRVFGGVNSDRDQLVVDLVVPVTPGVHTFRLCGYVGGAGVGTYSKSLVVETVAGGAAGGATLGQPVAGAGTEAGTGTSVDKR